MDTANDRIASTRMDRSALALVFRGLEAQVLNGQVAGLCYALGHRGRVIEAKALGLRDLDTGRPMACDTLVRIYSMTKPITGAALMILHDAGQWQLDDPITRYLPELAHLEVMTGADANGQPLTVPAIRPPTMRELMSHTAGFGYGVQTTGHAVDAMFNAKQVLAAHSLQDLLDRVASIPLKFQPGTHWAYSIGADLQAAVVERLSGQRFGEFLNQWLFRPLAMHDTGFQIDPSQRHRMATLYSGEPGPGLRTVDAMLGVRLRDPCLPPSFESGGGGLFSTLDDYARFAAMLAGRGLLDGTRVLSERAVALMSSNVMSREISMAVTGSAAVGFGLNVLVLVDPAQLGMPEGPGTYSFAGAAGTWFWIDPTHEVFFVGISQRVDGNQGEALGLQARRLCYEALARSARQG